MNTRQTYLTRNDTDCGEGSFDSISWALVMLGKEDDKTLNFAVLHGNEDSPTRLELWKAEPNHDTKPDLVLTEKDFKQ